MRTILPAKRRLIPEQAKRVFKGQIFDVYQWEQELFDGSKATFEMLKRPDTVQIMAIKDHRLVVLKEEQPSMGPAYHSLPGGRHDDESETELDAAKREMREETGMEFANWRLIDVVQPHSKIDWMVYRYIASDFQSDGAVHLDPGEKIEIQLLTHAETIKIARQEEDGRLPLNLLEQIDSIDDLVNLPQYGTGN